MNEIKLAELVGIILGDGSINIYKRHKRLQITLHSEDDLEYSKYIKNLFIGLFQEEPIIKFRKNQKALDILIFKRKIIYFFLELGLKKSPKMHRVKIPKKFLENRLPTGLLRGLFDTDGSLVITNNNGTVYPRLEIKVCNSPMQKQIIKLLDKYNFRFGAYKISENQVRIQMNGKSQLKKWLDLIGFSNPKHSKKLKCIAGDGFEPTTSGYLPKTEQSA